MRTARRTRTAVVAVSVLLYVACGAVPPIAEHKPSTDSLPFYQLESVPIVVVAKILANSSIGRPRLSKWDSHLWVQLYRAQLRIENVLRGPVMRGNNIQIYYFAEVGTIGGPPRLGMTTAGGTWHIYDREIFFLQTDSGVLRTTCDSLHFCAVPIFTGAHPELKDTSEAPIPHKITDVLLTRGRGCRDQELIKAIQQAPYFDRSYAIKKLAELARTETPEVRKAACDALGALGHACFEGSAMR